MADLGNLYFDILFRDKTQEQISAMKAKIEKELKATVGIDFDKAKIASDVRAALRSEKYKVDIVVDKAEATRAVREALKNAGLQGGRDFTAGDLRAERALATRMKAEAQAAATRELARQRAARAEKAELSLAEARRRSAQAALSNMSASLRLGNAMHGNISLVGQLKNEMAGLYSIYMLQNFLRSLVEIGGEMEKQKLALTSILQDGGKAAAVFGQIKQLAVQSPFGVMDLTQYAKQLSAYSIPYNELFDTMKRLADISAGVGVDMGRIILAFGQIRAAKFLKGTELRQLTEANVPMVDALAERFSKLENRIVSAGEVLEMISEKKVSFEDVKAVLWEMTDEGGMFYNMQEVLSESVSAKWKNLSDAIDIMLADMAGSFSGVLKGTAEVLTELTRNWQSLVPVVTSAATAYGVYRVAVAAANALHGAENRQLAQNALAMKQKQADALRLAASYRTLTVEELATIATSKKMTTADWQALASSGALTKEYALRLMALKRINPWQAAHIAQTLNISRAEMAAALSAKKHTVLLSRLSLGFRQLGRSMLAMATNPFTLLFAGLSAVLSLINRVNQRNEELKENIAELGTVANEGFKNLSKQAATYDPSEAFKLDDAALITGIEQMETVLKDYSASWGTLFSEVYKVDEEGKAVYTLAERYQMLAEAIRTTAEAYKLLDKIKDIPFEADAATGGVFGWVDETLSDNLKDYSEARDKERKALRELMRYSVEMSGVVQRVSHLSPEFAKDAQGKTLEEQVKLLLKYRNLYNDIVGMMSDNARIRFNLFGAARHDTDVVMANEVMPDLEKWIAEVRSNLIASGVNVDNPAGEDEEAIRQAIRNYLQSVEGITKEVQDETEGVMLLRFGLQPDMQFDETASKEAIEEWKRRMDELTDGRFTAEIKATTNVNEAVEMFRKRYKELKDGIEQTKPILISAGFDFDSGAFPSVFDTGNPDNAVSVKAAQEYAKYAERQKLIEAMFRSLGLSLEEDKKGGDGGKDVFAERMKERLSLIKDAYSEYKKWAKLVGEEQAIGKLKDSGVFAELFAQMGEGFDPSKLRENVQAVMDEVQSKGATTKQRRDLVKGGEKMLFSLDYDETKDTLDAELSKVKAHIDKTIAQWDLYEKLFAATGDREASIRMAFTAMPVFDEASESLRDKLLEKMGEKGLTGEPDWGMDEAAAEQFFGGDKSLLALYNEVKKRIEQNGIDLKVNVAEAMKDAMSIQERIKAAESQRDAELADTGRMFGQDSAEYEAVAEKWRLEIQRLQAELLEASPAFRALFADTAEMSIRQVNALYDRVKSLIDLVRSGTAITDKEGNVTGYQYKDAHGNDGYMSMELLEKLERQLVRLGKKAGGVGKTFKNLWEWVSGKKGEDGHRKQTFSDIIDDIGLISGEASKAASSLSEMFSAMGNDSAADGLGLASDMLSGISGIAQGIAGGNPFAVVSGLAGIVTSIFSFHDKKLQRQIEASKQRAQEIQNLYDAIERDMEYALSEGYMKYRVDEDIRKINELKRTVASLRSNGVQIYDLGAIRKSNKEIAKYQARVDAYEEGGAYGYQRQLMTEQLAELEKQRQAEIDKKKTDDSVVADYEAQIEEMKQQIRDFAEEAADTLYGINLKDWASQLGDALYEAWQKGEDGAEAFRNKVGEIMGDVMNEVLKVGLLQPAMENLQEMLFGDDGQSGLFGQDFELDENEVKQIADALMQIGSTADDFYGALDDVEDYLNRKYGVSMKDEDDSSGGLSKEISGVTEDTAGILASYINAIRADVGMKKEYFRKLVEDMLPAYSAIAQAQLQQLQQIQVNTANNAEIVGEIRDILRRNINGGNRFNV